MSIPPGSYTLGPEQAKLTVRTGKGGAAAKAGHNLLIEVTAWSATLELGDDPAQSSLRLSADTGSLTVLEGSGGIQTLGDDDKRSIKESIDSDVLKRTPITFESRSVTPGANGGPLTVAGELELVGKRAPLTFELSIDDDRHLTGTATVKQTNWGMKPFSILFGTIKVLDDVQVSVDGTLPAA